jgi:hypothetical protein
MKTTSFKIKLFFVFLSIAVFALSKCGDQALFDELATNRVTVKIKGTYESNNPRDWEWPANPEADSIYLYNIPSEATPTLFMLDVAGIKVANADGHNQYFANYRKTYSDSTVTTAPFSVASLFNGEGVVYKNDDMRPNFTWSSVQLYIRKMLFDSAKQFVPTSVSEWGPDNPVDVQDMFAEKTVNGFNFNLAQVLSYYDSLKMNYGDINRIFPLSIPVEDGFIFNNNEPETVLEIRLVIKNFVKKYEYEYNDVNGYRKLRHFYAVSDWLRTVDKDEPAPTTDTMGKMGGNLLAIARYYVPGKTATITGTAPTDSYVVAINSNRNIGDYARTVPQRERPSNNTPPICDVPKLPRTPITTFMSSPSEVNAYIEALLQYYLQYEVYKSNYDLFVNCTLDTSPTTGYEGVWNSYENTQSSYSIPPYVTYVRSGTTFELTNVPVGQYKVYRSAVGIPAGDLPDSFTQIGTTVTITEANFGGNVSP